MAPHHFENIQGTLSVRRHVDMRILDAVANSGAGREIEDHIEGMLLEDGLEIVAVLNISLVESVVLTTGELRDSMILDALVVGVVDVVESHDFDSTFEQLVDDTVGDKPGSAGDEG